MHKSSKSATVHKSTACLQGDPVQVVQSVWVALRELPALARRLHGQVERGVAVQNHRGRRLRRRPHHDHLRGIVAVGKMDLLRLSSARGRDCQQEHSERQSVFHLGDHRWILIRGPASECRAGVRYWGWGWWWLRTAARSGVSDMGSRHGPAPPTCTWTIYPRGDVQEKNRV